MSACHEVGDRDTEANMAPFLDVFRGMCLRLTQSPATKLRAGKGTLVELVSVQMKPDNQDVVPEPQYDRHLGWTACVDQDVIECLWVRHMDSALSQHQFIQGAPPGVFPLFSFEAKGSKFSIAKHPMHGLQGASTRSGGMDNERSRSVGFCCLESSENSQRLVSSGRHAHEQPQQVQSSPISCRRGSTHSTAVPETLSFFSLHSKDYKS